MIQVANTSTSETDESKAPLDHLTLQPRLPFNLHLRMQPDELIIPQPRQEQHEAFMSKFAGYKTRVCTANDLQGQTRSESH
jgi:hypothetical protein